MPARRTSSTAAGSPRPVALALGTGASTWARICAGAVAPPNGRRPVSSSKATTASE
jgi:hypothetical protein